ncbi:energy transducer TonB [Pseudoalteromonas piscicida]
MRKESGVKAFLQSAIPPWAASNIEGFAIASFSINKNGQTENVQINLSQPSGAFDKEVLNAIKTWRYTKPYSEIDKIEVQVEFRRQESTPLRLEKEGIEGILVTPEL